MDRLLTRLLTATVVVRKWAKTGTDEQGNDVGTYTDQPSIKGKLEYSSGGPKDFDSDSTVTRHRCIFNGDADVLVADRLLIQGDEYEVQSIKKAFDWKRADTVHHLVSYLVLVK